ncbi:MAG: hypothetical protein WDO70_11295 [Alphaproteobacteria bacterium]
MIVSPEKSVRIHPLKTGSYIKTESDMIAGFHIGRNAVTMIPRPGFGLPAKGIPLKSLRECEQYKDALEEQRLLPDVFNVAISAATWDRKSFLAALKSASGSATPSP